MGVPAPPNPAVAVEGIVLLVDEAEWAPRRFPDLQPRGERGVAQCEDQSLRGLRPRKVIRGEDLLYCFLIIGMFFVHPQPHPICCKTWILIITPGFPGCSKD